MTAIDDQLNDFVRAAQTALGDDLLSIVLFGSAAEGRLRPTSDVNVLLLLKRLPFERFLARLYTDADLLQRFLADPMHTAARHGLDETERSWLRDVDRAGLVFANESFGRKRALRRRPLLRRFLFALRRPF